MPSESIWKRKNSWSREVYSCRPVVKELGPEQWRQVIPAVPGRWTIETVTVLLQQTSSKSSANADLFVVDWSFWVTNNSLTRSMTSLDDAPKDPIAIFHGDHDDLPQPQHFFCVLFDSLRCPLLSLIICIQQPNTVQNNIPTIYYSPAWQWHFDSQF